MAKVVRNDQGVRLYPVCGFQRSQHKLFYWREKAWLRVHDSDDPTEKDYEELQFWDEVMEYAFTVYDGLIYVPYKYYERIKEAIVMYDHNH